MKDLPITLPANAQVGTVCTVTNVGSDTGWVISGNGTDGVRVARKELLMSYQDLSHPAYKAPVAELVDLWITRYGNEWIDAEVIDQDPFYRHVHNRLRQLGQLEQHYLTDRNKYVCRRPE